MKLMIDIYDDAYKYCKSIKNDDLDDLGFFTSHTLKSVANGIALPEGAMLSALIQLVLNPKQMEEVVKLIPNCEDAISRADALNVIAYGTDKNEMQGQILKLDKVELVKEKGEWIPVSERLPENKKDVLVCDYSNIFVAWYDGKHGRWHSPNDRFDIYLPILAWQPLPEPYKEKG